MPYRDPARRAAWMREYRKRKRGAHKCARAARSLTFHRACTGAFARPPANHRKTGGRNPRLRTPGSCRRAHAVALKPRWSWRGFFRSGCTAPRCARIAITPVTVRPVPGAAIVEAERDEGAAPAPPARPSTARGARGGEGREVVIYPTRDASQYPSCRGFVQNVAGSGGRASSLYQEKLLNGTPYVGENRIRVGNQWPEPRRWRVPESPRA